MSLLKIVIRTDGLDRFFALCSTCCTGQRYTNDKINDHKEPTQGQQSDRSTVIDGMRVDKGDGMRRDPRRASMTVPVGRRSSGLYVDTNWQVRVGSHSPWIYEEANGSFSAPRDGVCKPISGLVASHATISILPRDKLSDVADSGARALISRVFRRPRARHLTVPGKTCFLSSAGLQVAHLLTPAAKAAHAAHLAT